ncbi:MAG TPA: metallopeptidase TldD-related protein [Oculatellaceae cyanobacterium]
MKLLAPLLARALTVSLITCSICSVALAADGEEKSSSAVQAPTQAQTLSPAPTPTSVAASSADTLINAMNDEMVRTLKDLKTEEHPTPYFMSYMIKEVDEAVTSSCLGAKPTTNHDRERLLFPIVRVGNYDTDSSYPLSSRAPYVTKMPLDDDYNSVRRYIWLHTDVVYKYAVRALEWKKAYLAANSVPDRLADMSSQKSAVFLNPVRRLSDENEKYSSTIQQLSKLFEGYPTLQKSKVSLISRVINYWYVNSEGARVRESRSQYVVKIWAAAQASDGMPVSDTDVAVATEISGLPSFDELKKMTIALAQRVADLRIAAKGDDYCGPILFEGQGAAELFSQVMAPNFGFAEEYLGSEGWRNPLKNGIGRKILPTGISVVDNPSAKDENGRPLPGDYMFDDEGVAADKVKIVQDGVLKSFCQSRLPTRHSKQSNGHSLGGHGVPSVLEVSSSKTNTPDEINQRLAELAKEAGLDYIMVVPRIKDDYVLVEHPTTSRSKSRPYATPSYSVRPTDPVMVYKQYLSDGHRELVRGLEFRFVSLRAFRDIQAVGKDSKPWFVEPNDCITRALVTPSFVVGEIELTPVPPEHSTPPIVSSPLQGAESKSNISKSPEAQPLQVQQRTN